MILKLKKHQHIKTHRTNKTKHCSVISRTGSCPQPLFQCLLPQRQPSLPPGHLPTSLLPQRSQAPPHAAGLRAEHIHFLSRAVPPFCHRQNRTKPSRFHSYPSRGSWRWTAPGRASPPPSAQSSSWAAETRTDRRRSGSVSRSPRHSARG